MPVVLPRLPTNSFDSTPVPYVPFPKINILPPVTTSFEDGTTGGWNALANSTPANVGIVSLDGYRCLSITAVAAGDATVNPALVPVATGNLYVAQVSYLAATTPRNCAAQINWYTAGSAFISAIGTTPPILNATNGWVTTFISGIAPATATQATVVGVVYACSAGEVHYMDHYVLGLL